MYCAEKQTWDIMGIVYSSDYLWQCKAKYLMEEVNSLNFYSLPAVLDPYKIILTLLHPGSFKITNDILNNGDIISIMETLLKVMAFYCHHYSPCLIKFF